MIELEHSPLGGSGAHRFLNCEFSFLEQRRQIEADDFENVPTEFAERGTGAHELGATCLSDQTEPYEYVGREFNGYKAGWPDGIALDAVTVYVAECRKILESGERDGTVFIERTIKLPLIHPLLKGTVDFGLIDKRAVWLRDYKNGEGIGVAAAGNEQLLYYALLLIVSEGLEHTHPRDFPVSLGIIQPNYYGLFEEPDTWVTTIGHVLSWGADTLLPRMNALMASSEHGEATPGDWCQFCPVLLSCPKMQTAFRRYAAAPEEYEVLMLTNEELDGYYADRENARRFMKVLETTIHARAVAGHKFQHAKLVEKKTARVWKPGAAAAFTAALGDDAFNPKELKSPAQMEKLSTRAKAMTLEYGYKPDSAGLSIAPLSDPRAEASRPGNAGVFANFAQSPEEQGF